MSYDSLQAAAAVFPWSAAAAAVAGSDLGLVQLTPFLYLDEGQGIFGRPSRYEYSPGLFHGTGAIEGSGGLPAFYAGFIGAGALAGFLLGGKDHKVAWTAAGAAAGLLTLAAWDELASTGWYRCRFVLPPGTAGCPTT